MTDPASPVVAFARLFRAAVPRAVLATLSGASPDAVDALVDSGALVTDVDGVRPNPLFPGPAADDVAAAWAGLRTWLETASWPSDALLVDGIRLAWGAGDVEAARSLLQRLALGAVLASATRAAADALVETGLVRELLGLDRTATLLLIVDGGRGAAIAPLLREDEAWLRARARLADGDIGGAAGLLESVTDGGAWADIVAADALSLSGRTAEAMARLDAWFDGGSLIATSPTDPLLRAELLRAAARVFSEAQRFEEAGRIRAALEELAVEHGEPRLQLAVLLGRAGDRYRLGRFREARRWIDEFDRVAARVPSSTMREGADLIAAILAVYAGEDPANVRPGSRAGATPALESFWTNLECLAARLRGDHATARERAADLDGPAGGYGALLLGQIALEEGRLDDAHDHLARVPSAWPVVGDTAHVLRARRRWLVGDAPEPLPRPFVNLMVESMATLLDVDLALEAGDLHAAEAHATRARSAIERHGHGWLLPGALLRLADLACRRGDPTDADRLLDRAEAHLQHPGAPAAAAISAARRALSDEAPAAADWAAWTSQRRWRALGLAARAHTPPPDAAALLSSLPDRLVALAAASFPRSVAADALHVRADGSWFQAPGAEEQSLARRRSMRRILAALVAQRQADPETLLTVDDLLAAGWPGEKVLPFAGRNRVHVALTTLRGMGLRDVLLSDGDGYHLDPSVPLSLRNGS